MHAEYACPNCQGNNVEVTTDPTTNPDAPAPDVYCPDCERTIQ